MGYCPQEEQQSSMVTLIVVVNTSVVGIKLWRKNNVIRLARLTLPTKNTHRGKTAYRGLCEVG
jgi:hypothetical protein